MGKQLNIRSDEAFELAHRLAASEETTVAAVVVEALRQRVQKIEDEKGIFSEGAVADRAQIFEGIRNRFLKDTPAGLTSNHGDLYDENGLPT